MAQRACIVVLTGAGISAESGLQTFRDAGGLWEGHAIHDVATPEAWARQPEVVNRFYNQRRQQLLQVAPNAAHIALAQLEQRAEVRIITQNVDDLHERAGSTQVLHLHGQLLQVRSSSQPDEVYDWRGDLTRHDVDRQGQPLRPNIVWFGEAVPAMDTAVDWVQRADQVLVVGTSLQVYPAAGLLYDVPPQVPITYIDPHPAQVTGIEKRLNALALTAVEGVPAWCESLFE